MTHGPTIRRPSAVLAVTAIIAVGCADDTSAPSGSEGADGTRTSSPVQAGTTDAERPLVNLFLAETAVPIGHGDAAQSDWSPIEGPAGSTAELATDELTYQHFGPAHFGIAISPEHPDGRRTIWSNGGDRVSKLDYETLEVIDELSVGGDPMLTVAEADAEIEILDGTSGVERATEGLTMATEYLTGLSDIYYLLDNDNTLFVGGSERIAAYRDTDPSTEGANR